MSWFGREIHRGLQNMDDEEGRTHWEKTKNVCTLSRIGIIPGNGVPGNPLTGTAQDGLSGPAKEPQPPNPGGASDVSDLLP